jgi:hypothetical protein
MYKNKEYRRKKGKIYKIMCILKKLEWLSFYKDIVSNFRKNR